MAVDKENTPTHYAFDGTVIKGTMNAHYVASPHPAPGDLRRVSSMDVSEETGNSAINVAITLDYQEADGFYVPKNVSFNLIGAYAIDLQFSGCSANKGEVVHQ